MAGSSSRASPIVISSSDEEEKPVSPPVDAILLPDPQPEYEWPPTADLYEDDDVPRPDWLPDGFGMEFYKEDDGTIQPVNFICPVTNISFGSKDQVLDYCISGGLQRAMDAKNTLDDKTTLQGKYAWLRGDHKWLLEIRAGGENERKMFKVYAHPSSKVRITSKAEVMRLINEGKVPDEPTNDKNGNNASNKDNIIAQLDFNVPSLPPGWVKETVFRKCSRHGIRTDRYYIDPVTEKACRSLKAAEEYFKYEKESDWSFKPSLSITDLYSFDGCVDMPPWLARRIKMNETKDQCEEECQTSCHVGEDKKDQEEGHYGGGNEKQDNEEMPHGDDKKDEDEQGELCGSDKVGVSGEGVPCGDGAEDGWRFRSLTELYSVRIEKGNSKRKGKKKNK